MAIQMITKNTFVQLVDTTVPEIQSKRSSSLPRSWKPDSTPSCGHSKKSERYLWSDVSTEDCDECSTVADNEASSGAISSGASDGDGTPSEHSDEKEVKAVLCLSDSIVFSRTKLTSKARLFEPVSALPRDMRLVLTAAQASLSGHPKLTNVHMSDGSLGGTTRISASYKKHSITVCELVKALSVVKMALLDAAAKSTETYILGYEKNPFIDHLATGPAGFNTKLGAVPAMQEDTTCWDTYQKGYCPRQSTCRWCHPCESDFANVVVILNELDQ